MSSVKTESAVVYTAVDDSRAAGSNLGEQLSAAMAGAPPDAVILFVSPKYDAAALVECVTAGCGAKLIVGCSSAGEFTNETDGVGKACAVGIRSSQLQFAAGIGRGISSDRKKAAQEMVNDFRCGKEGSNEYCTALILTDALAGHADELIEELTLTTAGSHQFFGGGAGDDANFQRTQVFSGKEIATDAAVALEIISEKPIGIGVRHGWSPATKPMRVTESKGAVLVSLNASPILDVFREHAQATSQRFDEKDPMPFFLHNILGIETGDGYKLRVPLAINPDSSVLCAAEIPQGATLCVMTTDSASAREAAANATRAALQQLNGHQPGVALFFDCVATRLRMGKEFGNELEALKEVLGETQFAGCNTYGQVARTTGQFNGFIIAQPSSAFSRRKRAADPEGRLLTLIAGLTAPANRRPAARALAEHAGAEDLLVFLPDRELGILLPAPGFPQTLPSSKRWQAFLGHCTTDSFQRAELPFPDESATAPATGLAAEDGSVLVLLGGAHDLETAIDISLLLPMIAAAFEGERTAEVAQGNTAVAKQAANQAKLLAASLEKAREELRHTLADARRANAAKDRFLAVLSHELRTPLNPVLMAASAMETDPNIPPEIRADISMIRRNVELEARLIDDLLDLTRISNGKIQLHRKIIDAHELLEQAAIVVRGDPSESQAEILLKLSATNLCMNGDPARIQQVFWNLIRNGVKFTPSNGKVTVRTENAEDGDRLRIVVEDTGIGIEAETLPKIFNAFEQGDTDVNRVYGGLGLGLAISKVLVELHGGSLQAESEGIGKGASFILEFDTVSRDPMVDRKPAGSMPTTGTSRRILLVEDHATTAALMARLLRRRGHHVHLADTKTRALAIAEKEDIDLVISDLGLPDGNGYEVMEALRAKSSVIGIALTGYGMESDIERSVAAGFRFHLTKPVDAQKLFSTIEQL